MNNNFVQEEEPLSLSLQSYDSDIDLDVTFPGNSGNSSILNETADCKTATGSAENTPKPSTEEDEYFMHIASKMGLSGISKESMDRLFSAFEQMKIAERKNAQAQMILDAVSESVSDSSKLPQQMKQRIRHALEHMNIMEYVAPGVQPSARPVCEDPEKTNAGILGLTNEIVFQALPKDIPPSDLKALKVAVESQLNLKLNQLHEKDSVAKSMISKVSSSTSNKQNVLTESEQHTFEILQLKKELEQETENHKSLLIHLDTILSKLADLKRNDFPSAASEMCSNAECRSQLFLQQLRFLNMEISKEIYTEDPCILDAYKELKKQLTTALYDAQAEYASLNDMEEKYKNLKGTEYDNLLKEYRIITQDLEKKKYFLQTIDGNKKK